MLTPTLTLTSTRYSEEEQAAVADLLPKSKAAAGTVLSADELKALIASIPTAREPLYAEPVAWEVLDGSQIVEAKLRPFVHKKITEYLGEETVSLTEHVVSKLTKHTAAAQMEAELAKVSFSTLQPTTSCPRHRLAPSVPNSAAPSLLSPPSAYRCSTTRRRSL